MFQVRIFSFVSSYLLQENTQPRKAAEQTPGTYLQIQKQTTALHILFKKTISCSAQFTQHAECIANGTMQTKEHVGNCAGRQRCFMARRANSPVHIGYRASAKSVHNLTTKLNCITTSCSALKPLLFTHVTQLVKLQPVWCGGRQRHPPLYEHGCKKNCFSALAIAPEHHHPPLCQQCGRLGVTLSLSSRTAPDPTPTRAQKVHVIQLDAEKGPCSSESHWYCTKHWARWCEKAFSLVELFGDLFSPPTLELRIFPGAARVIVVN